MIRIQRLRASSFSKDAFDISWEIEDTNENLLDYAFFVQRSEGESGPFDTLAGPMIDLFLFQDVQAPQYHRHRQLFYRIRILNLRTNEESLSGTTVAIPEPDLYALEIQRLEFVRLSEFAGRRVWVFPKRTFGQRCSCWDTTKQRSRITTCPECFGTGFSRGFLQPIETFLQIEPSYGLQSQGEQISDIGKTQHNVVAGRAFISPLLKTGDLIVEAENIRWRVVGAVSYQHLRHPVAQAITMLQIPDTDVEYRIPLTGIDLVAHQATPSRAFTNYANVDSAIAGESRSRE